MSRPPADAAWRARLLAWLLFAGAAAFVLSLPRVLGISDEGLYLYESKMLLQGRVLYRDLFEIVPPGSLYLLAGVFRVFGPGIATARAADAVLQAGIVTAIFALCRTLGVRPLVAVAAALAHLAALQPAWPYTSPHWIGTFVTLLVVRALLVAPERRRGGPGFVPGVLIGLLACLQHQKAVVIGAGAVACLGLEFATGAERAPALPRRLGQFVAGALVPAVPLFAIPIWSVGLPLVWQALVGQLFRYAGYARAPWGWVGPIWTAASYTFPRVLPFEPVLTVLLAVRVAVRRARGGGWDRPALVLVVMSAAAMGSVAYFADYIHLAIIGPTFLVILAALCERLLATCDARPPGRWAARLAAATLVAAVAFRMAHVMTRRWAEFPATRETPFGTMQFAPADPTPAFAAQVRDLVGDGNDLLVFPGGGGMYLLTGAVDPTPYQFLVPGFTTPEQFAEVTATLDRRAVRYAVEMFPLASPVRDFVSRNFTLVLGKPGGLALYRRAEPSSGG